MRMIRRLAACAAAAMFAAGAAAGERGAPAGEFDFYVLSLSWSPSYCAAEGEDANRQQCSAARPFAFVVHGLWPQYEKGYPEHCSSRQPQRVADALVTAYRDIMPSAGLVGHQWRKHGMCSGLNQEDYFALARKARERVKIPQEFARLDAPLTVAPQTVETLFRDVNPGLEPAAMAVTCDRRYLREVRICLTKELAFRACPAVDRNGCRSAGVLMPPARGG
ncbi:ribonuclease T2 [Nitratireductor sp. ZSWI3]|uniref:ribonuclease T2 n=1 Tax=Nitratireductor sp. ZSWI3 TaxID=2966359 RepID=UPI00214FE3FB|nr:ribonuclease T2 [Nitratireductor sp. ZSWI3]MCR4267775.1 ribonuclease T2 [Nitratireductor sp. ZSWI3]